MRFFGLGFLRERRARSVVEGVMPSLPEGVQLLGKADRAATLAIANSMLEVGAETWGEAVLSDPSALTKRQAAEAVLVLADHHVKLRSEALEPMQRRNMDDVAYAQAMRELRATEVVIGTVGARLLDAKPPGVRASWKLLWEARTHAVEGARTLADFAKHSKARPVLRARSRPAKLTSAELVRLASTLPPFLMPKGKSPGTAKTTATGNPAVPGKTAVRPPAPVPGKAKSAGGTRQAQR